MNRKPEPFILIEDNYGIYIPKYFANAFEDRKSRVQDIDDETWKILEKGPDHPEYWEAWSDIEQNAVVTNIEGIRYFIYMDGDCWLIPFGMSWNDETESWIWPNNGEEK